MGRREDPFADEQIQEAPHKMGREEKELRRDATIRVRVDYLEISRSIGEVILFGLALSE